MMKRQDAVARVTVTWQRRANRHNAFYARYPSEDREDWCRLYRHALQTLLGSDNGPLRVLDVGTGTGFVSSLLAELGHEVTGIDVSSRMLGYARGSHAPRNPDPGPHQHIPRENKHQRIS